jgi:hypothetical protein
MAGRVARYRLPISSSTMVGTVTRGASSLGWASGLGPLR